MVQGLSGIFNAIGKAINTQKTALENKVNSGEGDAKSLKALDALETISDAFTSTADLKATESFDDKGVRTLTYTDPTTNLPVKSTTYDPSGKKTGDADYDASGKLVNSATYDPTTGKKQTDSHYNNGVLTQTDVLDGNGNVVGVVKFNSQGQRTDYTTYDSSTGQPIADATFDPATGNPVNETTFDPTTGKPTDVKVFYPNGKIQYDEHTPVDGNQAYTDTFDSSTGALVSRDTFHNDGGHEFTTYGTDGEPTNVKEYDANGNLTFDGDPSQQYKNEIKNNFNLADGN